MQSTNFDLTGDLIGTMRVQRLAGRAPLKWSVKCERCGSSGMVRHDVLTNSPAPCLLNVSCKLAQESEALKAGRSTRTRAPHSFDPDQLRVKPKGPETFRRFKEEQEAQERRNREAAEAEEQRQREEAERPIRELESQANQLHQQLAQVQRERIMTQRDPEAFVSPALIGARMSLEEAAEFNRKAAAQFVRECQWYYRCPENLTTVTEYLQRNGIELADAEMFKRAAERLRAYGLLKERPVPEREAPAPAPRVSKPKPAPAPSDDRIDGYDLETGQPRKYTSYELDRLSAHDYRRALRLVGDRKPRFIDARF
jgi:hypothetical protein